MRKVPLQAFHSKAFQRPPWLGFSARLPTRTAARKKQKNMQNAAVLEKMRIATTCVFVLAAASVVYLRAAQRKKKNARGGAAHSAGKKKGKRSFKLARQHKRESKNRKKRERQKLGGYVNSEKREAFKQRCEEIYACLQAKAALPQKLSPAQRKSLGRFYNAAYQGEVDHESLNEVGLVKAYTIDKFVDRANKTCLALLNTVEAARARRADHCPLATLARQANKAGSPLRVACIGGGPGNDAAGFAVFNHVVLKAHKVELCVYDFSPKWQSVCETLGEILASKDENEDETNTKTASVDLSFELADLRDGVDSAVNRLLVERCPDVDVFILSHCVHESG